MNISITVKNLETNEKPLYTSPIVPALYLGHNLIAFGNDIVKYFDVHIQDSSCSHTYLKRIDK